MTDEQIVKALECCSKENECQVCPYGAACLDDKYVSILSKDALDLIKRQKAEVAELKSELILKTNDYELLKTAYEKAENVSVGRKDRLMKAVVELQEAKAEIDELRKRIVFWREDLNYQPEAERAKAIKEFVERLKTNSDIYNVNYAYGCSLKIINKIAEEWAGVSK